MTILLGRPTFADQSGPQVAASDNGGIQEIIVTARKRAEDVQKVPVSVTPISAEQIQQSNIRTMEDFQLLTPGLQATENASAGTSVLFNIRGFQQSGNCFQCESPVSVYVDGVYRQSTNDLYGALFDLDGAQILKGPQGTLYGKNTTGGAVLISTRKPSLTEGYGGYITGGVGTYGATGADDLGTQNVQGAVNIPLIPDMLAARIAGAWDHSTGYGRDGLGNPNYERGDSFWRTHILAAPSEDLQILVSGEFNSIRNYTSFKVLEVDDPSPASIEAGLERGLLSPGLAFCLFGVPCPPAALGAALAGSTAGANYLRQNSGGSDLYSNGNMATREFAFAQSGGGSLTADWDLSDDLHVKSISAYRSIYQTNLGNYGGGTVLVCQCGSGTDRQFWSEELTLGGKSFNNQLDWLTGIFDSEDRNHFQSYGITGFDAIPVLSGLFAGTGPLGSKAEYHEKSDSFGIFGHAIGHLSDDLSFTAGLRWSQDTRHMEGQFHSVSFATDLPFACQTPGTLPGCDFDYGQIKTHKVTYEFALNYQVTSDMMVYATSRRGFHSGDWNSAPNGAALTSFGPETDTDYEVGVKSQWLDHRLIANAALFHNDFDNIQRSVSVGTSVVVSNAAGAQIDGAELELHARPLQGLDLGANYSYLEPRYTKYVDPGIPGMTPPVDYTGEPFSISKHSIGLSGTYSMPLGWGDIVTARADLRWQSLRWLTDYGHLLNLTSDPLLAQPAYASLNMRLTYTVTDYDADISVLCSNCTNETYLEQGLNLRANTQTSNSLGVVVATPGVPRYVGLEVTKHFGGG